ncbi:hypothetical protein Rleg_5448 (plasmid) [Rhizobium leguminosarum bv. trifolii WSM1325]|uniref:Lipoprotein n=1 Tax=Rhizobium leguminosarum bv. trifolii (strain WSM1325) TaxID=395491 RepID=C6B8N2_RHILS|nr:hypothetical protein [Rhizobium leguminosarum]ACS60270.1 hypothetical protein Rleg_5448 [Rhizobium leguminosarum bv. trifolii WSM1325]
MSYFLIPKVVALLAVLGTVQSCSSVYSSSALEVSATSGTSECLANMGTYFLPKGELSFVVLKKPTIGMTGFRYDMKTVADNTGTDGLSVVMSPDERHQYCLDFKPNSSYSDVVRAQRNELGLLTSVYSNVEDQSKTIVEDTARGIALAVAAESRLANRDFLVADPATVVHMKMQFDPFDLDRITSVNRALEKSGYCIYIDPKSDPFVPFWMRNQCSSTPQLVAYNFKGDAEEVFSSASYTAGEGRFGILYKPALSHTLVILKRDDPTSGKPWRIWKRQIVELPNRAPVFMLQVSRGFFTARKSEITFQNGMLASVEVDKKSELKAVSEAFVNVVSIVVRIPAKALIIGTNEAKNQEALIRANQALLQAYAELEAEQRKQANLKQGLDVDGLPRTSSARTRAACLDYADLSAVEDPNVYCQDKAETQ